MLKKNFLLLLLIASFSFFINPGSFAQMKVLSTGAKAPTFNTRASMAGNEFDFSLKEALEKGPVVLYFYPSAYTGGCDLEAHTFAEMKDKFTAAGATVIGVSADDIERLKSFSSNPEYCAGKFPVASDAEGKIAASYGLQMSPSQQGAKDVNGQEINHGFIPRTTFVINKNGEIIAVFSSTTDHISPDEHVKKSLEIVSKL